MKRTFFLLLLASLFLINCNNDDNGDDGPTDPLDELPAATQTGAQTLGCLINGEPFIPSNFGNSAPNAFYQFVDGAYTLSISASSGGGDSFQSILIGTIDNPQIIDENSSYELISCALPNYCGELTSFPDELIAVNSQNSNPGLLTITRFDESIISGTFAFTVLDNDGNEITITDGRFDLNYTN
ncbi:hypothetical protein [Dokdonia donghaensis]|uniref:Uncharacterized protein n=1 Tax=Dokdonia donghaensis DSW-1 TaxID=1300343 RepID=A0A0A2H382_9FLAO|nr:hypothetical protein [Dokdonia donghaensis]ANH59763.1 hypothetical protein I597_0836 [Dokdonia donghaensis DSW-1]KGO07105.1 hypothetical protein NV36_09820 [Dokdonia donghaensis DSW-1]